MITTKPSATGRSKPAPPPPKFSGMRKQVEPYVARWSSVEDLGYPMPMRSTYDPEWRATLRDCKFPTAVVVLDFESYFDDEISMRGDKLSTIEYVTHPESEVLGCSVLNMNQPFIDYKKATRWYSGENGVEEMLQLLKLLYGEELERCTVVCQNARFDLAVLAFKYNLRPRYVIDTLGLARHWNARTKNDLDVLAKRFGLPEKGDTQEFKGWTNRRRFKRAKSRKKGPKLPQRVPVMTPEQKTQLAEYANNDVMREWELFTILLPLLSCPDVELRAMQHTLELFTKPRLKVDYARAEELKQQMDAEIDRAVDQVNVRRTQPETKRVTRGDISGENSFEALLKDALFAAGCDLVEYVKPTKKKGKTWMFALAKDDPGREKLEQHPDEYVRLLMAARIAVKSWPLHIKRVDRIVRQAKAAGGYLPVPLKYCGAHCFTGDAEVLTREGWVRLDSWGGGCIMQWKPDGTLHFAPATANKFRNSDPMVRVDSPYITANMTAGHTVARYNSTKTFDPCSAGQLIDKSISYIPISGRFVGWGRLSPAQIRLLVAVQADGSWQVNTRQGRELRFGLTKPRKQERLRTLLADANVPYREAEYPSRLGEITFRIRWADCPWWLSPDRKQMGPWLLDSTPVGREAAIGELVHWGGGQYGRGDQEYYSTEDENHEWVAVLCHVTGRSARRSGNTTVIRQTCDPQRAVVQKKHVQLGDPASVVYCPTTQTGYWIVRQAGNIHITGNTGRWSGGERINLQNLGSRGHELVNAVRELLVAPEGKELVIADASQIEARVLAWLAGQWDLVEKFAKGEEIYCGFAEKVLGYPVRKPKPEGGIPAIEKRMKWARNSVGKIGVLGCIAEDTPVLTERGWVGVQNVRLSDRVWDGEQFVPHEGAVYQGVKPCVQRAGIWMTEDHEVYGRGGWCPAVHLDTGSLPLATPTGGLRWKPLSLGREAGSSVSNVAAPVVARLIRTETTWSPESLHAAIRVLKLRLHGRILTELSARNLTAAVFLAAFVQSWDGAKHTPSRVTADAESDASLIGSLTEQHFYRTCSRLMGGTSQTWKSTGSTMTGTTSPAAPNSPLEARTCRTWDIIRAGSNRRFQAGPLMVANCGYGMGPAKAVGYAKGAIDFETAKKLVKTYRDSNAEIVKFWYDIERAFTYTYKYGKSCELRGLRFHQTDRCDVIITLPSGRELKYHTVRLDGDGYDQSLQVYNDMDRSWAHVWGGYLTENVVQAISRDILWHGIAKLEGDGYNVALHVHDELIAVVDEGTGRSVLRRAVKYLSERPEWARDLPLAAEGVVSTRYGGH